MSQKFHYFLHNREIDEKCTLNKTKRLRDLQMSYFLNCKIKFEINGIRIF